MGHSPQQGAAATAYEAGRVAWVDDAVAHEACRRQHEVGECTDE
ncbi:MAG TPA: hypothetical protein VMM79_17360 [Longimicrobiales bacterium]|nr:hypothetical protein [Longimicrobiales bacterium]